MAKFEAGLVQRGVRAMAMVLTCFAYGCEEKAPPESKPAATMDSAPAPTAPAVASSSTPEPAPKPTVTPTSSSTAEGEVWREHPVPEHLRPSGSTGDVLPLPEGRLATVPFDSPEASSAVIQRRFYCFHQDPKPEDVPKLIETISRRGWLEASFTAAQVSGFVTVNVERYPEQMQPWLEAVGKAIPVTQQAAVWRGIWNANVPGTEDVLRGYAEKTTDATTRDFIRQMVREPKWPMLEGAVTGQLDAHRLIGALVASGSDEHLARVISTMEYMTPSRAKLESMGEVNAGANAKASLTSVAAMNDEILAKVRAQRAARQDELGDILQDVVEGAEAQRESMTTTGG